MLLLLLPAVLAAGEYRTLSSRSHRYSSSTCLASTHRPDQAVEDLACSVSLEVVVRTEVSDLTRTKRFVFLPVSVDADCPGLEQDQLLAPFQVQEAGQEWGQEAGAPPARHSGRAGAEARGLQGGLAWLLLEGEGLHQGRLPGGGEGCEVEHVGGEGSRGYKRRCQQEPEGLVGPRVVVEREVGLKYGQEGGREVWVREEVRHSSMLGDEVGLVTTSTSSLRTLGATEDSREMEEELSDTLEEEVVAREEAEPLERAQRLLVVISKTGAISVEGTAAFLDLVALLRSLGQDDAAPLVKKFRTKAVFVHVVEAAAGCANPELQSVVLDSLLEGGRPSPLLERFLLLLSLSSPSPGPLAGLAPRLEQLPEQERETALYCLCRAGLGEWLGEEEGGEEGGERRRINCLVAGGRGGHGEELVWLGRDGKGRERVLAALGTPGLVGEEERRMVEAYLREVIQERETPVEEQLAALSSLPQTQATLDLLLPLLPTPDPELSSLLVQQLSATLSKQPLLRGRPRLHTWDSLAPRAGAQSLHLEHSLPLGLGLTYQTLMAGPVLRRSHLRVTAGEREVLRLHAKVGGMSGLLGEQQERDDKEANAVAELSILGLPLRPLVLFSSLGDLMDLYWSGAAEEKTSLLAGSVALPPQYHVLTLASGLPLAVSLEGAASLQLSGQAEVSLWTQAGTGRLELEAALVARLEAGVGRGLLLLSSQVTGSGLARVETTAQLGGGESLACVRVEVGRGEVAGSRTEERRGEEARQVRQEASLQGLTWNLGPRNNLMCKKIG